MLKPVTSPNNSVFSVTPRQGSGWDSCQAVKRDFRQRKKKRKEKKKEKAGMVNI